MGVRVRPVADDEKDEAIALARRDFVAGKLSLEQFEAEVGYALAGDLDRCGYLSPFAPIRDFGVEPGVPY